MGVQQILLGGSEKGVVLVNTDNDVRSVLSSTQTFTAQNFGAADSTRQMVVCFWSFGGAAAAPTSVTIGGVSATQIVNAQPAGNVGVFIFKANVPTGTSGNVVIIFSSPRDYCAISLYSVINASTTVSDTASDVTLSSNSLDVSLDIPVRGAGISCCEGITSGSFAVTWSGITEDYDTQGGASTSGFSAASKSVIAAETAAITATITATASFSGLAACSFEPL